VAQLDILIPHYNDLDGLALSLRSIARQSWKGESRVVIADDGSAPTVLAAVEALIDRHPATVTLLRHAENRGRPYMRNALLDALDSPYAAWLDAGDEWLPGKIEAQFADLKRLEAQKSSHWITCNWYRQVGHKRKLNRQILDPDPVRNLLLAELHPALWTLLAASKSFLDVGRFDEKLERSEDHDFFLRFLLQGGEISMCSVREPLCLYYFVRGKYKPEIIRPCTERLLEKHRATYERMGRRYIRRRVFNQERACARYAARNSLLGQELLRICRKAIGRTF
jgi:glycosyltransferase involved in cell wall biosynthesis